MKNKVYIIGDYDSRKIGGVITGINTLVTALEKHTNIDLAYITHDKNPYMNLKISKHFFKFPILSGIYSQYWINRVMRSIPEDAIIHFNVFRVLPRFLDSLKVPQKVILSHLGWYAGIIEEGFVNPYYLKALITLPDIIICDNFEKHVLLDKSALHLGKRYCDILDEKSIVFPPLGVDSDVFDPNIHKPSAFYNKLDNDKLVVFKGGAIADIRGDGIIIKAAERILSKRDDVYFCWSGYLSFRCEADKNIPDLLSKLQKRYPKNVFYLGKYDYNHLPRLLKGADVVPILHAKCLDGLGMFGMESLMMGKFCLASNIGWYKLLLRDCRGVHFLDREEDEGFISEVIDIIEYCADNIDEIRTRGKDSRKYALELLSAEIAAKRHERIYKSVVENSPLPSTEEILKIK